MLDRYRNYLGLLVRLQVVRLSGTVDVNSLLQEIWLEIHRKTALFQGVSEREFLTWVRRIIGTVLAKRVLYDHGTKRRDLPLERALVDELDQSSRVMCKGLKFPEGSLGEGAVGRDPAVLLADVLHELPSDYREVIILRQLEGLRFPEVASRLGLTEESARASGFGPWPNCVTCWRTYHESGHSLGCTPRSFGRA